MLEQDAAPPRRFDSHIYALKHEAGQQAARVAILYPKNHQNEAFQK